MPVDMTSGNNKTGEKPNVLNQIIGRLMGIVYPFLFCLQSIKVTGWQF